MGAKTNITSLLWDCARARVQLIACRERLGRHGREALLAEGEYAYGQANFLEAVKNTVTSGFVTAQSSTEPFLETYAVCLVALDRAKIRMHRSHKLLEDAKQAEARALVALREAILNIPDNSDIC